MTDRSSRRQSSRQKMNNKETSIRTRPTRTVRQRIQPHFSTVFSGSSSEESYLDFNSSDENSPTNVGNKRSSSKTKSCRTPHKVKSRDESPHHVTPPKQRKLECDENTSPASTPVVLLERLSLTERQDKSSSCKLFKDDNVYQSARRALHTTFTGKLPGREKELNELKDFIEGHLENQTSGSLYISGPPGTGKTASLNLILENSNIKTNVTEIYVNCTTIKSSGAIFARIAKDLGVKTNGKGEKESTQAIANFLKRKHKTVLLVLDEIDQLESKRQSVLYTIFEWPATPNSNIILIGIANALDLTDRILPRLQANCELKPQLMHFASYTKEQIIEIITDRLSTAEALSIFPPTSIHLLAAKVASVSGDIRRALDIGRRVLEMVDQPKNPQHVLKAVENLAEELKSYENKEKKMETVGVKDVITVLNKVYGASQNLDEEIDDSFPLQQKIIVCCLLLILRQAKNKDVTIGRLYEVYRKVCLKRNIQIIDQGEFFGLCSLIETRGILRLIKKKDSRMSKVNLMWNEDELSVALKDKQLMSSVLQDNQCLGKM